MFFTEGRFFLVAKVIPLGLSYQGVKRGGGSFESPSAGLASETDTSSASRLIRPASPLFHLLPKDYS